MNQQIENSPGTLTDSTPRLEEKGIYVWLLTLGLSLSISLAFSNILIFGMLIYLIVKHPLQMKKRACSRVFIILLVAACIFQFIGIIHDGWIVTKAFKIFTLFSLSIVIGSALRGICPNWLPFLLLGMTVGLIVGTGLNLYIRPKYDLWATYAMSYSNQAAGFAMTTALLAFALRRNLFFIIALVALTIYLIMSGERSGTISLLAAGTVYLLLQHHFRLLVLIPSICIAALTSASLLMPDSFQSLSNKFTQTVRVDIWKHGLLIAEKDCFLGRGEQHAYTPQERLINANMSDRAKLFFSKTYPEKLSEKQLRKIRISYHSQPIQHLVEYGLLPMLFYLSLLLYPVIRAYRSSMTDRETLTILMIWSAFAAHSFYETAFDNHSVIVLGLLGGLMMLFEGQPETSERRLT